ncbi:MAG: hypothetical protein MI724_14185 [Spirochaetales bacterium]|nr:hypothetical protein [Spirochaetales bacterium]
MSAQITINRFFHTLPDATRRAILRTVAYRSAPISESARPFSTNRATLSKHTGILEGDHPIAGERGERTIRRRADVRPLDGAERTIGELRTHGNTQAGRTRCLPAEFDPSARRRIVRYRAPSSRRSAAPHRRTT